MINKNHYKLTFIITVSVIVLLVLIKIISSGGNKRDNNPGSNPRTQHVSVKYQIIQPKIISEKVVTVGTILSNEEVEIRSEMSGKITNIYFKEGDKVKKGELLLKINDDELQARLLSAQSRQRLAEQQEERQRQLVEKNLVSQVDYDKFVNELDVIKAEVQLIQAQLDKTEIRTPFDGIIGLRYVSEGSYISPTILITTFQDIGTVKIDFTFPEKYSGEIKPGNKITFNVQGTSRKFSGTVYAISPKIDPNSRTLRIRAICPNHDGYLLPGRFANVEVQLKEKEALAVPSYAVIPEMKKHKVFIYTNGNAEERTIEIGTRTEEHVEVANGLKSGDTLITSAILQLRSGMAVKLSKE
jgi:membrane fusion protein (multidrug efflux system)